MASRRLAENVERPTPNGKEFTIRSWCGPVETGVSRAVEKRQPTRLPSQIQSQGWFAEPAAES